MFFLLNSSQYVGEENGDKTIKYIGGILFSIFFNALTFLFYTLFLAFLQKIAKGRLLVKSFVHYMF